jgi:hypothetical protein
MAFTATHLRSSTISLLLRAAAHPLALLCRFRNGRKHIERKGIVARGLVMILQIRPTALRQLCVAVDLVAVDIRGWR